MTGLKKPRPVSFEHDIIRILTKASCNSSGGCHGKVSIEYPSKTGTPVVVFIHPGGHKYL